MAILAFGNLQGKTQFHRRTDLQSSAPETDQTFSGNAFGGHVACRRSWLRLAVQFKRKWQAALRKDAGDLLTASLQTARKRRIAGNVRKGKLGLRSHHLDPSQLEAAQPLSRNVDGPRPAFFR